MIYAVTKNKELFESERYKIIGVDESLSLLEPLRIVGVDTETSGLSCHKDKLLLLQLGCFDFQVVIDYLTTDITLYKTILNLIGFSYFIMLSLTYSGFINII